LVWNHEELANGNDKIDLVFNVYGGDDVILAPLPQAWKW
jgi:hypothetical protein